jgi:hypothetical protein
MIMNRYNQTGGSNAFLRMFSCAGNGCGDVAGGGGRAGWRSRGSEGGGMGKSSGGRRGWLGVRFEVI